MGFDSVNLHGVLEPRDGGFHCSRCGSTDPHDGKHRYISSTYTGGSFWFCYCHWYDSSCLRTKREILSLHPAVKEHTEPKSETGYAGVYDLSDHSSGLSCACLPIPKLSNTTVYHHDVLTYLRSLDPRNVE